MRNACKVTERAYCTLSYMPSYLLVTPPSIPTNHHDGCMANLERSTRIHVGLVFRLLMPASASRCDLRVSLIWGLLCMYQNQNC
jgi:hypothetical protein